MWICNKVVLHFSGCFVSSPHIEGRRCMLYFNIQRTKKYSIVKCYLWQGTRTPVGVLTQGGRPLMAMNYSTLCNPGLSIRAPASHDASMYHSWWIVIVVIVSKRWNQKYLTDVIYGQPFIRIDVEINLYPQLTQVFRTTHNLSLSQANSYLVLIRTTQLSIGLASLVVLTMIAAMLICSPYHSV